MRYYICNSNNKPNQTKQLLLCRRSSTVTSKSQQIRDMAASGMTKGQIAKALDIRFQFVYNVLRRDEDKALLAQVKSDKAE